LTTIEPAKCFNKSILKLFILIVVF